MAVGGALFSGGGMRQSGPKALVSFKAGKMNLDAATNLVTADKRKGQVTVEQGEHDQLMHFKWKDRSSGNVEDDLSKFRIQSSFKIGTNCAYASSLIKLFRSHFPRRHRVPQGQGLHYGEGVHPQVQELLEEDVLLDAGAEGGQGRGQLQEGQRLSQ